MPKWQIEKKHGFKNLILACLAVSICFVFFSGCQETPEEPAVIEKTGITLDSLEESLSDEAVIEIPESWNDTVETDYVTVHVVANVHATEQSKFPVYQVEGSRFTPDLVDQIASEIIASPITSRRSGDITRDDVEMMLAYANRGIREQQSDGTITYGSYDGQQEYINELTQKLESGNLPDAEYKPTSSVQIDSFPTYEFYALADGSLVSVECKEQSISILTKAFATVQTQSMLVDDGGYMGEGSVKLNPDYSAEQAINTTEVFLKDMGIEEMRVSSTVMARLFDLYSYDIYSQGWMITYNHTCDYSAYDFLSFGGNDSGFIRTSDESLYAVPWYQERITFYVDKNGIQMFSWNHPAK